MDKCLVIFVICSIAITSALRVPHHHGRPAHRYPFAPVSAELNSPQSIPVYEEAEDPPWQRAKRNHHDYDDDYHHNNNRNTNNGGITGPVHTFVKTDKNANYKWGVRHHVGPKYV